MTIEREPTEVLIRDDLQTYLAMRYAADGITSGEIGSIIRDLETYSASDLYGSNKAIMKMVSDGFLLKRDLPAGKAEVRSQKDLLDYELIGPSAETVSFYNCIAWPFFERSLADWASMADLSVVRDTFLPKLLSGNLNVSDAEELVEGAT